MASCNVRFDVLGGSEKFRNLSQYTVSYPVTVILHEDKIKLHHWCIGV